MNDTEVLARTLFGEARANDVEDAEAIACVIMNRVGYRNWPGTISEVCLQPWQFSAWNANDPNRNRILRAERGASKWFDACWQIAERAVKGEVRDRTRTSTHYHTRAVAPKWSRNKSPAHETQGHLFFNNIDTPAPRTEAEALALDRPLTHSRTVVGAAIAAAGVAVGALMPEAAPVVQMATGAAPAVLVSPEEVVAITAAAAPLLGPAVASVVSPIATLLGIALTIYARWDDRRRGLR